MSIEIRNRRQPAYLERQIAQRAVNEFIKRALTDRGFLLWIVSGGKKHWIKMATKAFRGLAVSREAFDALWEKMVEEAGEDPKRQFDELQRADIVAIKLQKLAGLLRFIESEEHLDEVLERYLPDNDERTAIRQQMLELAKKHGWGARPALVHDSDEVH